MLEDSGEIGHYLNVLYQPVGLIESYLISRGIIIDEFKEIKAEIIDQDEVSLPGVSSEHLYDKRCILVEFGNLITMELSSGAILQSTSNESTYRTTFGHILGPLFSVITIFDGRLSCFMGGTVEIPFNLALINSFIIIEMAMAVLGNLASAFLPKLIGWGANKLRSTNIGRGISHAVASASKFAKRPEVRQFKSMIMNSLDEPKTKQIGKNKKIAKMVKFDESTNNTNEVPNYDRTIWKKRKNRPKMSDEEEDYNQEMNEMYEEE